MVKLDFRISPIVNLYYYLERGGLSKRYLYAPLGGYRSKALGITDRNLLDRFSFLLDREYVHSLIVSNMLGLRWGERYIVYIIEPTSLDFKPCGNAIYGEGAAIEAHIELPSLEIVDLVIHELSHKAFDSTVLRLLPERLRTDYEDVNEAIIFLITNTALERLNMPKMEECKDERSRKVASYVIPFWKTWQERLSSGIDQETFEDFLGRLMAGALSV